MEKILFFNGWGMDDKAIPPLPQGIILNYPYDLPPNLDLTTGDWIAIGWSFGAYYLNKFIHANPHLQFKEIIAINGHGEMLGPQGIKPKMLNLTLKTLTPTSLQAFYKNMELPLDKANTTRTFDSIKAELAHFAQNYAPIPNHFTKAILSTADRIVPTKAMVNYFTQQQVPITYLDAPHYPFQQLNNWEKLGAYKYELST